MLLSDPAITFYSGLREYVAKHGFGAPVLINIANAIEARYNCLFDAAKYEYRLCAYFTRVAKDFISEMWAAARSFVSENIGELPRDKGNMTVWSKMFNLFWMSQRCVLPKCFSSSAYNHEDIHVGVLTGTHKYIPKHGERNAAITSQVRDMQDFARSFSGWNQRDLMGKPITYKIFWSSELLVRMFLLQ